MYKKLFTTPINITDEQIRGLMYEAGMYGDKRMHQLCEIALYGDFARRQIAREACARAIAGAQAMA